MERPREAALRALITGATGFIGRYVFERAASWDGAEVHGLSASGGKVAGREIAQVNLEDTAAVSRFVETNGAFEIVFHFSARVPRSFAGSEAGETLIPNISQTQNALACLVDGGHIVYASGTSVYGSCVTGVQEEGHSIPAPDNSYSIAKYAGEHLCLAACRERRITATALRISAPYGPGQRAKTVLRIFLEKAIRGERLTYHGSGKRSQDFTFVGDVAEAALRAADRRVQGAINVATGAPIDMKSLAETIAAEHGRPGTSVGPSGEADDQEEYRALYSTKRLRDWLGMPALTPLSIGLRSVAAESSRS